MKVALRRLLICALFLAAGSGAQAQSDEVLERYGLALANLSESMSSLSNDITASRDELDRAAGALRFLAARADSPRLIGAMERVFERARLAIQNRSQTDLGVQTSLLRGGFQRAVYDSALALAESDRDAAMVRLERLAADLNFSEESREALARATGTDELRRAFEAAVAETIRSRLELAEQRYAQSRDDAYRALADAYADFLLIQDSPRADSALNSMFAEAVDNLVGNRGEEMVARLQSLGQSFEQLSTVTDSTSPEDGDQQADQGQAEGQSPLPLPADAAAQSSEGAAQSEQTPAGSTADTSDDVTSPLAAVVGEPTEGGQEPAGEPQADPAVDPAVSPAGSTGSQSAAMGSAQEGSADAAASEEATEATLANQAGSQTANQAASGGDSGPNATAAAPAAFDATGAADGLRALERELLLAGVPAPRTTVLATDLHGQGVSSLAAAMDELYASEARLLAALQVGDDPGAQRRLADLNRSYDETLKPVLALVSPPVERRTARLFEKLSRAPLLRTQDGLALLGQLDAVGKLLAGEPTSPVRTAVTETGATWTGWLRLAVLIFLALLAAVPLYLLNLAFGGGNRNWQLIGVALFLLLLPMIYEGVASLAGLAGHFAGAQALNSGLTFSMFQNPIGQLAWVAVTAAGILFAAAGLYGICVQFGLIGKRRMTPGDSQTMISTSRVGDTDTAVDWDEEF